MPPNDFLSKNDFNIILEVNKKAIEMQATTASQNEEIIENLEKLSEKISKLEELDKKIEGLEKTLFKLQIIVVAGLVPILLEAVKLFFSK